MDRLLASQGYAYQEQLNCLTLKKVDTKVNENV